MLCVSRHQGEKVRVLAPNGDEIWVVLVLIDRNKCRIGIEAKPEYLIEREEIIGKRKPPASGQGREGGGVMGEVRVICEHCGGVGHLKVEWRVEENDQGERSLCGPYATRAQAEAKLAEDEEVNRRFHVLAWVVEKLVRVRANHPSPGAMRG